MIYRALIEQLLLVLMRIDDGADKPRERNRASLPNLERLLRDEEIQANLIAEAERRWPSPLGIERTQEAVRKRLADIVDRLESVRQQAPFKAWLDSLRKCRNIFIAHSIDDKVTQSSSYGNIGAILGETLEIGESLRLVVCHQAWHWQQVLRARHGEAECFWDAVVCGMRTPQPSFESRLR